MPDLNGRDFSRADRSPSDLGASARAQSLKFRDLMHACNSTCVRKGRTLFDVSVDESSTWLRCISTVRTLKTCIQTIGIFTQR